MSKATKRSEDLFAAEIQDRKEEGRRFSAFEVLGIGQTSEDGSDSSILEDRSNTPIREDRSDSLILPKEPRPLTKPHRLDSEILGVVSDHQTKPPESKRETKPLVTDYQTEPLVSEHQTKPLVSNTPIQPVESRRAILESDPRSDSPTLGQTVRSDPRSDSPLQGVVSDPILLAPLQRAVYDFIRETEGQVIQISRLMAVTSGSQPGIRKAIKTLVLEGLCEKEEVRQKDEATGFLVQGLRFRINPKKTIRAISLEQAHYVQKRGGSDTTPARLSVSLNTNIQTEQVVSCLALFPEAWGIKARTLRTIADQNATMTALEFRYSILDLVSQVREQGQPIRHPNAYIVSAFKNGPLVTEADIQARLDQKEKPKPRRPQLPREAVVDNIADIQLLYIEATEEERAAIDAEIERRLAPVLPTVAESHHAELRREARLEATREYFRKG